MIVGVRVEDAEEHIRTKQDGNNRTLKKLHNIGLHCTFHQTKDGEMAREFSTHVKHEKCIQKFSCKFGMEETV
jgi:hypothetical protein